MSNTNTIPSPLTRQEGDQLAAAVGRFHELREMTIKTPTHDAELKGLIEYISGTMLAHAGEFLGCWIAVRDEYEPILNLVARCSQRVTAINSQVARAVAARQAEADKVTPLIQP